MNCEWARQLLPDYLTGGLPREARAQVDAHIAECEGCRDDVAMWSRLAMLPDEQPSPALRSRFYAMLGVETRLEEKTRRKSWLEAWWPRRPALQFALALAMTVIGVFVGRWWQTAEEKPVREVATLRDEVRDLKEVVGLLRQQSASERLRGVNYSYRMERADSEVIRALLATLKLDPSVDVRLAAVDALKRYAGEPAVLDGLAGALDERQSPLVQIALIDALVDAGGERSAAPLRRIRERPVPAEVRQHASWGLEQLRAQGVTSQQ